MGSNPFSRLLVVPGHLDFVEEEKQYSMRMWKNKQTKHELDANFAE